MLSLHVIFKKLFYPQPFISMVCINWFRFKNEVLKHPLFITVTNHEGGGGRCDVYFPGLDTNVWRVNLLRLELWGSLSYLTIWKIRGCIGFPFPKTNRESINPKWWWELYFGEYNQQKLPGEFDKRSLPVFCNFV